MKPTGNKGKEKAKGDEKNKAEKKGAQKGKGKNVQEEEEEPQGPPPEKPLNLERFIYITTYYDGNFMQTLKKLFEEINQSAFKLRSVKEIYTRGLSEEERQHVLNAQADAKKLLQDPVAFNKRFEEIYGKYDKDRDGSIEFKEYQNFISDMLISMGRTKVQSKLLLNYFERADGDNSGRIDKEEFRKEFKKRLREFYMMNV